MTRWAVAAVLFASACGGPADGDLIRRLEAIDAQLRGLEYRLAAIQTKLDQVTQVAAPPDPGTFPLHLPRAHAAVVDAEVERVITITITSAGEFSINGTKIAADQLANRFKALADEGTDATVVVAADRDAPYKEVVIALDAARTAGFSNLSMATVATPDPPPP